jgi:hypothetical protein
MRSWQAAGVLVSARAYRGQVEDLADAVADHRYVFQIPPQPHSAAERARSLRRVGALGQIFALRTGLLTRFMKAMLSRLRWLTQSLR